MGNHHSSSHSVNRTRKNVHWKSAGRPAQPGKPDIIPILSDDEPNAITLRWAPASHDGGAPLRGYQVECNRLGSSDWVRTAPPVVIRPELVLTGLDPPHRYQFRVAALNAVGRSEFSELSDVLTVNPDRPLLEPPLFLQHLDSVTVLENDKTEFRVAFAGSPPPTIAWFKDDYEIFSSRRTAISTTESTSVLVFHQTLPSDEGEVKCTATNRAGHAVTKGRLSLEAAPKLRYPRQYEDGLLYEINETVFLKTTIVGKPVPTVEWRHDGQPIIVNDRVQITNTTKFSLLKIHTARRADRGEYQIQAKNNIGEDTASFLVTITAPPDPPRHVLVTRQVDKSVTLDWEPPEDDGGCRIGNYIVEYYRSGWNVWLKATTSRKTSVTLFDLIEGSEYKFRVKAESPYGMSAPSLESAPIRIPGRSVDMEFLAVESRIINEVLQREDGQEMPISPAPRRKRASAPLAEKTHVTNTPQIVNCNSQRLSHQPPTQESTSNEFMLVLYPENTNAADKAEKRKSFQLDLEDALSPPPISLSAPELNCGSAMPQFKALRNAVSSTELLHERAMARFYKAVAMKEEQSRNKEYRAIKNENNHIPYKNSIDRHNISKQDIVESKEIVNDMAPAPEIVVNNNSVEEKLSENNVRNHQESPNLEKKWQSISFEEDYTASTVSTDEDYSNDEDGSFNGDIDREHDFIHASEEEIYNPRDKLTFPSSDKSINGAETLEREAAKSLPDPSFIPKPILKRRETDMPEKKNNENIQNNKVKPGNKNKKEDKMTLFKKITKMPVQKPFSFPKILNKKHIDKNQEKKSLNNGPKVKSKVEKHNDHLGDEGKTVIDYYGNIVKEYGNQRKPHTPLYLSTDDLKKVAEKQQTENTDNSQMKEKNTIKQKKKKESNIVANTVSSNVKEPQNINQHSSKPTKRTIKSTANVKTENKLTYAPDKNEIFNNIDSKDTQVILRTMERATVVIPIDYKKLEERAKLNVRTAINYTVDVCLLLLAFWVYIFKDEILAIPFLILIIYRQLQESILINLPEWTHRYTPSWLKKKIS